MDRLKLPISNAVLQRAEEEKQRISAMAQASGELGDDVPCVKCGEIALDTGLECTNCGHDNYEAITGRPFDAREGEGEEP